MWPLYLLTYVIPVKWKEIGWYLKRFELIHCYSKFILWGQSTQLCISACENIYGEVEVYCDIFYVTLSTFAMCPVWIKLMIVHRSDEEDYKKESRLISRLYTAYSVCTLLLLFFSKSRLKILNVGGIMKGSVVLCTFIQLK